MPYHLRHLFLSIFLILPAGFSFADESVEQNAILITGASSGFGRNIAETFAAEGHYVYAGARKQADLDALNAIENIQAIRLDVTIQEEIDAAVETIRNEGRGLYGLVNNAGVSVSGPRGEMEEPHQGTCSWICSRTVNQFGPYRWWPNQFAAADYRESLANT